MEEEEETSRSDGGQERRRKRWGKRRRKRGVMEDKKEKEEETRGREGKRTRTLSRRADFWGKAQFPGKQTGGILRRGQNEHLHTVLLGAKPRFAQICSLPHFLTTEGRRGRRAIKMRDRQLAAGVILLKNTEFSKKRRGAGRGKLRQPFIPASSERQFRASTSLQTFQSPQECHGNEERGCIFNKPLLPPSS